MYQESPAKNNLENNSDSTKHGYGIADKITIRRTEMNDKEKSNRMKEAHERAERIRKARETYLARRRS